MGTVTSSPEAPSSMDPSSSSPKPRPAAHADAPPKFESVEQINAFVDEIFPGPHRCNPRMDDLILGLLRFPPSPQGTVGTFIRCLRSNPGEEPSTPFKYLPEDYFTRKEAQLRSNRTMLQKFYLDQAIMREEQEIEYQRQHSDGATEWSMQSLAPLLFGPNSSGSRGYRYAGTSTYPVASLDDYTPFKEGSGRTRIDTLIERQQDPAAIAKRNEQQAKREAFLKAHSPEEVAKRKQALQASLASKQTEKDKDGF